MQKNFVLTKKYLKINELIENKIPYPDKKDLIVKHNFHPIYKKKQISCLIESKNTIRKALHFVMVM